MKTITLTNEEAEMISEDIKSTFEYYDQSIRGNTSFHDLPMASNREEWINSANTAESILKKLAKD